MNRLCIYVTYNKEFKIEAYVGYMLKALREHTTTLYVVCNYPHILDGKEYVEPYADEIFYRENRGYDAGAYKDMLCTIIGWDKIYQYDELVLLNDSFFGPFYNLIDCFDLMDDVNCDFWGMTQHPAGEFKALGYRFESHIQSYFLVFRSQVLKNSLFKEFWGNFTYPNTFTETIINFEIGINLCLKKNGFIPKALTDVWGMIFKENQNPTFYHALELIRDKGLPILKKKIFMICNRRFENAMNAVDFLQTNELYPIEWIWEWIDRQFYIEDYAADGDNCLDAFRQKYKKVYIYGAGVCGKNLRLYFERKGWKEEGIIVSDLAGQDIDCIAFDDVNIDEETGIVVSVIDREASGEIEQYISSKCSKGQLFFLSDCTAVQQYHLHLR